MSRALLVPGVASVDPLSSWVERARGLTVDELRVAVKAGDVEGKAAVLPANHSVEAPGVLWGFPAPPSVRAAFDGALDLYRRLEGGDATVTSFIEALVAEDYSSSRPSDVFQQCLNASEPRSDLVERQLASLLVQMSGSGLVRELGFSSIGAYAENRLGLSRTSIEDRVRVARALAKRPRVQRAYVSGAIGLEKALLAVKILGSGYVDTECENEWAEHLRQCTVKRLRDEKRALLFAASVEGRIGAAVPMTDEAWLESLRCAPGDTVAAVERAGHVACGEAPLIPIAGSVLRWRLPEELARDFGACIDTRCEYLTLDAVACDWSQPISNEDPPSRRAARTFSAACRRLPSWVGLLAMHEEFCAQYDHAPKRSASHSEVLVRSGHRCETPGCTSRRVEWNHRHGQHGGCLRVTGETPIERVWRLGPARHGVWYRNERRTDVSD